MALKKRVVVPETSGQALVSEPDVMPLGSEVSEVRTVNGKPIPAEFIHLIPFANTDQGIAEANRGRVEPSGVRVTSDSWDKGIQRRSEATELWESFDPLKDAVDRVAEPGMSYKLLSPDMVKKRGTRKFEVVKAENGDPVTVGNMVLGKMPTEMRDRRNQFYEDRGNQELRDARNQTHENMQRLQAEAGGPGLRPGEIVRDRTQDVQVPIGIERYRAGQAK